MANFFFQAFTLCFLIVATEFSYCFAIECTLGNDFISIDTNYTSAKPLQVFHEKSDIHTGHILFFLNADVCYACKGDIFALHNVISDSSHQISTKIILIEQSQEYANAMRKENGWSIETVGDEYGTFRSTFGIKAAPCFVVLDSLGRLITAGKLSGHTTMNDCMNAIRLSNRLVNRSAPNVQNPKMSKHFILRDSTGIAIIVGKKYQIVYNKINLT
jgi:hypothetical protein